MAYMTHNGKGPYPNKRGEYCGNYLPTANREQYLQKMRFGRPRPCESGTTKEMEARGVCWALSFRRPTVSRGS